MDIIVSDTNILIDLIDNHLLDAFFNLPYTVTTIDLVVREIKDDRQK